MQAILKAAVDLIFFGGIGTYVRASSETDDAVDDRANDAIRVTGGALRAKVIGEGANLGMTQRGRIEAALRGTRLNTDAIDNSAGVNTSDIEVNLKIALATPMRDGRLTREERNCLLAEMTDVVAALVLRNNYLQSLALSLAERRGLEDLGFEQRLMQTLETAESSTARSSLPDDGDFRARRRSQADPTRAVRAARLCQFSLNHELPPRTSRTIPISAASSAAISRLIAEKFPDAIEHHQLRRRSSSLSSRIHYQSWRALLRHPHRRSDRRACPNIAAAFAAVRDSYGMTALNNEIDALDNKISGTLQLELYGQCRTCRSTAWSGSLRNVDFKEGLAAIVAHYRDGIAAVEAALEAARCRTLSRFSKGRQAELANQGVPEPLARRIASLPALVAAPDIVTVADRTGRDIGALAATYFAAAAFFRLDQIVGAARGIVVSDYFDQLALDRALDSIGEAERALTAAMAGNSAAGAAAVEAWVAPRKADVERVRMSVNRSPIPGSRSPSSRKSAPLACSAIWCWLRY
jgi:glutamate dehydrogenase